MTIGQFSARTGLPPTTLRYYEAKGLITVPRDGGGRRAHDGGDIEWVRFLCRLKETGMSLRQMQHYARLRRDGSATMPERLALLCAHRECVLEQQRRWAGCLESLDSKIGLYRQAIADGAAGSQGAP